MDPKVRIKWLLLIASLTLLAIIAIIIQTPPPSGYEFSIYNAYPIYFWILIIGIFSLCCLAVFCMLCRYNTSKIIIFCIVTILLLTHYLILNLPRIRDYYIFDRGDTLSHIGYIIDICGSGRIPSGDFYPISHIIASLMTIVTGLEIRLNVLLLTPLLILYINIIILTIGNTYAEKRSQICFFALISTIFVTPLVYSPALLMILFFLLYICLLYKYYLEDSFRNSLLLIIVTITMPFIHPLCLINAVIALIGAFCASKFILSQHLFKWKYPGILLFVGSIFWFYLTPRFSGTITMIFQNINSIDVSTQYEYFHNFAQQNNVTYLGIAELVMKSYGHILILGILSALAVLLYIYTAVKSADGRNTRFYKRDLIVIMTLIMCPLFTIFTILVFTKFDLWITYDRILPYMAIVMMFVVSFGFIKINQVDSIVKTSIFQMFDNKYLVGIILLSLIVAFSISLFNIYPSPIIKKHNFQVTDSDIVGMQMILTYRETDLLIEEIYVWQDRLSEGLLGFSADKKNIRRYTGSIRSNDPRLSLPKHFGSASDMLGDYYYTDRYLLLNEISYNYYDIIAEKYQDFKRYDSEDFDLLNSDQSVQYIYSNGGFNAFYIFCSK